MRRFPLLLGLWLSMAGLIWAQPLLDIEQQVARRTNEVRARVAAGPLELDPVLSDIARGHSEEMLNKNFFSHESPNQVCKRVTDRLKHGYRFCLVSGENLHKCFGYGRSELAKNAMDGWQASPNHYHNLVNPQYTRIGVGVAMKGDVALFTQVFSFEPILIQSLDVTEESGSYRVKVSALVTAGPTTGGWFVDGKRKADWSAGPDGSFSTELVMTQPGELDIGQADGRLNWSVDTAIPIPPPDKHFRHTTLDWRPARVLAALLHLVL